jgi:predicted amidophosphoribosyltransferase
MKASHSIISDHVFRGKTSGFVNSVTRLIYGAKFYDEQKPFEALVRLCTGDINKKSFDAIVPVNTRDSKYNLPANLAKIIASNLKIKYLDALYANNTKCRNTVKGLRVLIFDDVIYTGKTMTTAKNSVKIAGAKSVTGFAIARSRNFNINQS